MVALMTEEDEPNPNLLPWMSYLGVVNLMAEG